MPPHFEVVKSFADVPIREDGVETRDFLEATDGLLELFDLFGSAVFGFVQADLRMNLGGVRSRYEKYPEQSATLENLVRNEAQNEKWDAIPCLVRLTRGLAYTHLSLQTMQQNPNLELHHCFKRSYDVVLKHHHTIFIRGIVAVAIRAVPKRNDFYNRIAQGGSIQHLDEEMKKWLEGLDKIVKRLKGFLEGGGYGKV
ncbi:hypothetical protein AX16_002774 [Volvariella volvacea WC 439]|nr:hypothetical protein AX16_002774 [Volvariella volvacea WC 439]